MGETWEIIYMSCVLLFMLIALLSDRIGADMVMMVSLTLCMAPGIISIEEGLVGFSNEGILTVLVLFVVAAGIGHTGALDWYMGKLLGRPKTTFGGQLRLMVPISIVSAFLNNTPVVAIMIPIVQRWGTNVGINPQQLLVPLSFASILGGTCTLIGTSTNLVVLGLLQDRYSDRDENYSIGLFDLGLYGFPIAILGISYVLIASPFFLPGGLSGGSEQSSDIGSDILLGARLTRWSTAAGRSVKRSGLRDTGGIYLVSVLRAATGNIHRAVGQDFVLNVGDILYFTGLVEEFGAFCDEHGLELVTNEVETQNVMKDEMENGNEDADNSQPENSFPRIMDPGSSLTPIGEDDEGNDRTVQEYCLGQTSSSLSECDDETRLRSINKITDMIRGTYQDDNILESSTMLSRKGKTRSRTISSLAAILGEKVPTQIIIVKDSNTKKGDKPMVLIAINCHDRPGLLLDISKGLLRLSLQLHHSEAAVMDSRSLSVWRCEELNESAELEEIWSVLNALLESESGVQAIKERGLKVIRARVRKGSNIIGMTANECGFREKFKAAIVAYQRGANTGSSCSLSSMKFMVNDILVLQASDSSPLLVDPPAGFYKNLESSLGKQGKSRTLSGASLSEMIRNISGTELNLTGTKRLKDANDTKIISNDSFSNEKQELQTSMVDSDNDFGFIDTETQPTNDNVPRKADIELDDSIDVLMKEAWRDLAVIKTDDSKSVSREFLTAMEIATQSQFLGKSASQAGLDKLSGVFLVEIERPLSTSTPHTIFHANSRQLVNDLPSIEESLSRTISPEEGLTSGDILWFAGTATAIGDLRKIPGIKPFEDEQVNKIEGDFHERRLVQAVVAKQGPLVGKTVKDVRFRTKYGAAVIAVQRQGNRVHDHPGRVRLQAGDVLLLEAGPSFVAKNANSDKSFALLNEVKDSAPPRLRLLIPALALTIIALAVYTAGVASLLVCSLIASILMVSLGILTQQEVRDAINWEVYLTIAGAFGIGTALTNSGLAGNIADFLVSIGDAVAIGDAGLFGAVYFATFLISNVVTNNAAAALIFPIAIDSAEQTGTDVILMSYCVMLGASASFMSPFGYTTNILIYGPGGYTSADFIRIGTPMQIILWIFSVALLSIEQWYIGWTFSIVIFVIILVSRMCSSLITCKTLEQKKSDEPKHD